MTSKEGVCFSDLFDAFVILLFPFLLINLFLFSIFLNLIASKRLNPLYRFLTPFSKFSAPTIAFLAFRLAKKLDPTIS